MNSSELYLISSTKVIVDRCQFVTGQADSVPSEPATDPTIRFLVDTRRIKDAESIISTIGSVQSFDSDPPLDPLALPLASKQNDDPMPGEISGGYSSSCDPNSSNANDESGLTFTIKTSDPSKIAKMSNQLTSENSLVVEIRSTAKRGDTNTESIGAFRGLGDVVGQVIIETEVDRRFFPRHEVFKTLESLSSGKCPVMRITTEVSSGGL